MTLARARDVEIALTENARRVLEARYVQRNPGGRVIETSGPFFERVAKTIASVEDPQDYEHFAGCDRHTCRA